MRLAEGKDDVSRNDQELFELLRRRVSKSAPGTRPTEPVPPAPPPAPPSPPAAPEAPPSAPPSPAAPVATTPAAAPRGPAYPSPPASAATAAPVPDEVPARARVATAKLTGHKSISLRFDSLVILFIVAVVLFVGAYLAGRWQGRRRGGAPPPPPPSGAPLSPEEGGTPEAARRTPPPGETPIGNAAAMEVTRPGPAARVDRFSTAPRLRARFAVEVIRFRRNDGAVARERVDELKKRGFDSARCVLVGREWIVYVGRFGDVNDRAARERRNEIRNFERTPGHFPYRNYGEIVRVEEGR